MSTSTKSRSNLIQWNLDLTKSLGTGQVRSLNRGFVISSFFFIYFTITGAKNTVRYIEVFVKSRFRCNVPMCKNDKSPAPMMKTNSFFFLGGGSNENQLQLM